MRNIPVNLNAFELFVTATPEQAEFADKETGEVKKIMTKEDEPRPVYRVSIFAKNQTRNHWGKLEVGEEIEVQVPDVNTDLIRKGTFVELIAPTMTPGAREWRGKAFTELRWNATAISPIEG
ncbi:MAG: hypothetical protein ACREX3_15275 [Gammaproteobacteria bacterium]